MAFTCPRCGRTSHNPDDEREGYCGACHDWTDEAELRHTSETAPLAGKHGIDPRAVYPLGVQAVEKAQEKRKP